VTLEILEELALFSDLAPADLDLLPPLCKLVEGKAGDCLIREGELVQNLYILVSGDVVVKTARANGTQVLLASLGKDDLIGEISFSQVTAASATVEAKTTFTAVALNQKERHRLLDKQPPLGIKVYKRLARVMSGRMKTMIAQLAKDAQAP